MRILLFSALAATACSPSLAATRNFPVGNFDRIANAAPIDVRVHVGPAPSVRANGPQQVLDKLVVEMRGGELVVRTLPGNWFSGWRNPGRTIVDVTVPALNGATLTGPGNLAVDRVRSRDFAARLTGPGNLSIGSVEAGNVTINLTGPGDITLSGRAQTGRVSVSGPGDVHAAGLALRDAEVLLSGPGDIVLTASGLVRGRLSGPGDISVTGGARCDIRKSGPGDVTCR
jgi:hypothetical protein